MPETIAAIVAAHREGSASPAETVARSFRRIRDHNDAAIFISLRDESEAVAEAERLAEKDASSLPLLGVPVAVKDNIDAAGLPTTAACPAFAYQPVQDATSVARLRAAGAIVIGKTNLDQFATGLVGVRSRSVADGSTQFLNLAWPLDLESIVGKYRLKTGVA